MQVADNDGNSQTQPPDGVYVTALVLQAEGFEASDPFFFVHRTWAPPEDPELVAQANAARDAAADWVRENYDSLIAELRCRATSTSTAPLMRPTTPCGATGSAPTLSPADYDVWRDNFGSTASAGEYGRRGDRRPRTDRARCWSPRLSSQPAGRGAAAPDR